MSWKFPCAKQEMEEVENNQKEKLTSHEYLYYIVCWIFLIYNEFLQINKKKTQVFKIRQNLYRLFMKEETNIQ